MSVLKGLDARLRLARLQLITDLRRDQADLKDFLVAAINGGVDLVQLRDASASSEELVEAHELARSIAYQLDAGIVLASDMEAARRAEADYVHLLASDGALERAGLPVATKVGRSVHRVAQLEAAVADGTVDSMLVGPVFGDGSLELPGLGLVREAARLQPVDDPSSTVWFAVGGIDQSTIDQVVDAGALRVAVSGAITRASDPQQAAENLSEVLRQAWDARGEAMEAYVVSVLGNKRPADFV